MTLEIALHFDARKAPLAPAGDRIGSVTVKVTDIDILGDLLEKVASGEGFVLSGQAYAPGVVAYVEDLTNGGRKST